MIVKKETSEDQAEFESRNFFRFLASYYNYQRDYKSIA